MKSSRIKIQLQNGMKLVSRFRAYAQKPNEHNDQDVGNN